MLRKWNAPDPSPQPLFCAFGVQHFPLLLKPAAPPSRTQNSNRGHLPHPLEKQHHKNGNLQYFPWYSIFHCLISHHLSYLRTENRRQRIRGKRKENRTRLEEVPGKAMRITSRGQKRRREDAGKKGRPDGGNHILKFWKSLQAQCTYVRLNSPPVK